MDEHKEAAQPPSQLAAEEQHALDIVLDSPELVEKVLSHQEIQIVSRHHSGPLPSPVDLEYYNRLIDNGAERIMQMAEQEQQHRQQRQTVNDTAIAAFNARGQYFGLAAVVLVIVFALCLLFAGYPGLAATVVTGTIVSIAGVFVLGKKFKE